MGSGRRNRVFNTFPTCLLVGDFQARPDFWGLPVKKISARQAGALFLEIPKDGASLMLA